jgi:ABC-type dipeptide/oligopeptide/nickel transport system permease component
MWAYIAKRLAWSCVSELRVLRSHVVRNLMMPVETMLGMDLGLMFGNVIFVESVFSLPNLGTLLWTRQAGKSGLTYRSSRASCSS